MTDKKTISILGAGAMGWAIAYLISSYQRGQVKLWDRSPELISWAVKTRQNPKNSSPEIIMPKDVLFLTDLEETVRNSDLVVLAVPSFAVREMCQKLARFPLPPILMISKGMEEETSLLPFQVAEKILGKKDILHLTGTGYGKEVHKKIPTTEVLASKDERLLGKVKSILETDWLTIETTTDLLGAQLAGALKNVMVIGIGLACGSKENPGLKAKFIKEGVREMVELGNALGARKETFFGPAGKGDLELSADPLSRNYKLGQNLAEQGLDEILDGLKKKGITVEGFHTALAAHLLAKKKGVLLPIVEEVYNVIYGGKDPKLAVEELKKVA
ncbi:MAG: NAD(P)H-dependent glycerol-3-phosphate dehydrogenase [bacterium]|nr:NAD(P)H-dependent glycerol-3-phosphate dehydrogenase [bacterium]